MYPANLKYTGEHEWISIEGDRGRVGITDFAQNQLGDVVYVELPPVGKTFERGESFGTIESVKAVSELYCPMSGEIVDVNAAVTANPEVINEDPHQTWLIVLALRNPGEASMLLDSDQYGQLTGGASR